MLSVKSDILGKAEIQISCNAQYPGRQRLRWRCIQHVISCVPLDIKGLRNSERSGTASGKAALEAKME